MMTASLAGAQSLSYGELAVALYASSMPSRGVTARATEPQQIDRWVSEGLTSLGGPDHVAAIAQRSRELGKRLAKGLASAAERAEYRVLWRRTDRSNAACGLALHVVSERLSDRRSPELPTAGAV
jgi:hypothetical protein